MLNQSLAATLRLGINYWTEDEWDALAERLSQEPPPAQLDLEDQLLRQPQVPVVKTTDEQKQSPLVKAAIARAMARASRRG